MKHCNAKSEMIPLPLHVFPKLESNAVIGRASLAVSLEEPSRLVTQSTEDSLEVNSLSSSVRSDLTDSLERDEFTCRRQNFYDEKKDFYQRDRGYIVDRIHSKFDEYMDATFFLERTPLGEAILSHQPLEIIEKLIEDDLCSHSMRENVEKKTPVLVYAIFAERPEVIDLLAKKFGRDIFREFYIPIQKCHPFEPLTFFSLATCAVDTLSLEILQKLFAYGADLNAGSHSHSRKRTEKGVESEELYFHPMDRVDLMLRGFEFFTKRDLKNKALRRRCKRLKAFLVRHNAKHCVQGDAKDQPKNVSSLI